VDIKNLPGPPPKELDPVYCVTAGLFPNKQAFSRAASGDEKQSLSLQALEVDPRQKTCLIL